MTLQHFGKEYGSNAPLNYERFFVPAIGAPLATDLIESAMILPGERILDVACGTGIVARLVFKKSGNTSSVTGLDINPGMLAVAREVSPPEINWMEASAEEIPAEDNTFDVVLCQISLMFVPDKRKALGEMYRVLKPKGRILLSAPGPASPVWEAFAEVLNETAGQQAAGFVKQVFSLHDANEVLRDMRNANFNTISIHNYRKKFLLPSSKDFLWQYIKSTPLDTMLSDSDEGKLSEIETKIVDRWKDFEEDGNLTDELNILVASGNK